MNSEVISVCYPAGGNSQRKNAEKRNCEEINLIKKVQNWEKPLKK